MKKPNGIVPPNARGLAGKTGVSTKGHKRRRRVAGKATPAEHRAEFEAWARRAIDAKRMPESPEELNLRAGAAPAADSSVPKERVLPDLSKK